MLQLQTKTFDICRISKLLVKYNIKASISNQVITLNGDISDEMLTKLCSSIDINAVQNFISKEPLHVAKGKSFIKSEELTQGNNEKKIPMDKNSQENTTLSQNFSEYDLIYPEVKRGEVYLCDFGEPYGKEQGLQRYVIVIQNDIGNLHSPTTIVIPCTTKNKKTLPTHYEFTFSSQNMIDFNLARVSPEKNVILAEQIQTVDKTRLRKHLGTLTPEFMKIIEEKVETSLCLSRKVETVVEKEIVYVDKPVPQKTIYDSEKTKERKDVNIVQIQLLTFVDITELLKISQSDFTDEIKVEKILELFGFDFSKHGIQYLHQAIINSPKNAYFNLETLAKTVSQNESVDKEEIKRLIVARVKEKFGFKKAPTIDFIRLVNNFLLKQEVNYEEINV